MAGGIERHFGLKGDCKGYEVSKVIKIVSHLQILSHIFNSLAKATYQVTMTNPKYKQKNMEYFDIRSYTYECFD